MKLITGEFYLNAHGGIIKISKINKDGHYQDGNKTIYIDSGKEANGYDIKSDRDLIAHIPKQLHFRLCEIIEDYYTDIDVKEFIDDNYKMMEGLR